MNVLLLTGPAGAGKTTLAGRWAAAQHRPTIHLSLDDIRDMVRAGYANPEDGITPLVLEQLDLARRAIASMVLVYTSAGYRCVVDDAVFPGDHWAGLAAWRQYLAPLVPRVIVVMPSLPAALRHNRLRSGHRRLSDETVGVIYQLMSAWRSTPDVALIEAKDRSIDDVFAALCEVTNATE